MLLLTPAAIAGAQVVRGLVRERSSTTGVAGVVVSLERADSVLSTESARMLATVLTNEQGEFAVSAPAAGQYRLSAKRIGVQRYMSEPFSLDAGETRRMDIEIDAVLFTLPEVVVTPVALCVSRRDQAARVASLWEEANAALTATQISLRDRLVTAAVTRYNLMLDPATLRVLSESRLEVLTDLTRPFASISGDSLSKVGYWRELPGDSAEYYGPDAEVLQSEAFRRDHCFTLVQGGRDRQGMVGLAFEPVVDHRLPDVRGILWLDQRSFELRFVEFGYTRLPASEYIRRVGGEVHFARMPSGAWIVRRWFLRMPQYARYATGTKALQRLFKAPSTVTEIMDEYNAGPPEISRLLEEGGTVEAEGLRAFATAAHIDGTMFDSTGRPFRGVLVHLAGHRPRAVTDSLGRFHFDSLPAGSYAVLAEHPGYAALGFLAGSASVTLGEGGGAQVALRGARAREIVPRLCGGLPPVPQHATLRLIVLDSATATAVSELSVTASFMVTLEDGSGLGRERRVSHSTDPAGAVTFCGLPAGVPVELSLTSEAGQPISLAVVGLKKNEILARVIRIPPPR